MRRLRRSGFLRLWAAALLASLGLGMAAPASAAVRSGNDRCPLSLEDVPAETLERALAAAAGAATPEAFAEAVAGALRAALGDDAPSAEALLGEIYGHLLRVLREEFGGTAVVVAPGTGLALDTVPASPAPPQAAPARRPASGSVVETAEGLKPSPRERCPSVQPLGP